MIWAGSPFAQLVEFVTGSPTGDVSYQLFANDGTTVLDSGTITPGVGAVSSLIVVDGADNTCALPLFEKRTLVWSYTTADGLVSDRVTYRVNAIIPFAVTEDGVRFKLGVSKHELHDDMIDLVAAYAEAKELVSTIDTVALTGSRSTILATNAIEALAALAVLPSLQLRAGQSERSGEDLFSRFSEVDWDWLRVELQMHVDRMREDLDPAFDADAEGAFVFGTATRSPDAITGEG